MDLNTATITELQTLKGIGEVRAAAIINKRLELNNPLSMEDLVTAEVVPYDVLKNLLDTEAIKRRAISVWGDYYSHSTVMKWTG